MKYEITKGSEKDFDGGLSGCTHVYDAGAGRIWCSGEHSVLGSFRLIAERRPITEPVVNQQLTAEWDSEGLPPVGSTFDMRLKPNGLWLETKLIAAGQEQIIYFREGMEFSGHKNNYEFRPIRSPDEVARDEAIEAMRDVGYALPAAIRFTKEEMAALYDAGYRKME